MILSEVPPIDIGKCVSNAVASSNGMLELDDSGGGSESPEYFSMSCGLFVPGPKHMFDNIIGDLLGKLQHYESFQSSLKVCCASLRHGFVDEFNQLNSFLF